MPSILVVDDEPGVRSSLSGVLRDEGFDVETAASGEECLDRAARTAFDVIVLDVWLPGVDGLVTLQRLARAASVDAQVVMISGHGNIESAVRAIKMGAFDFVEKPLSLEKTVLVVRNALRQRDLEVENRALRARVDRQYVMVGESFAMRQLRGAGRDGGAHQRPGADLRRERHRQGARRAHHPPVEPPPQRAVRRGQLRGHSRRADRVRALRPSEGRVYRRGGRQARTVRAGQQAARSSSTRSQT